MTAGEVQSFLEQKVPRCTIGDPGRAPGAVYGSNQVADTCLRNFTVSTLSKPANAYCGAYTGVPGESASQIISRVGQVCGISQKVLLVMLEKEQSLISDSWPFKRQLDVAMGYGCPDSGPDYSANCDPAQLGFFNQVYRAAWQFKVYKAQPASYRYRAFQTNTIQWHPNPNCGSSQVYIENWATAALYIYTPYRPNQAALEAGWGTGDSCSTYGNRNFFSFYTSWFGSTQGIQVHPALQPFHDVNGGLSGEYGRPTSSAAYSANGLVSQSFTGGILYWSPADGFGAVTGAIRSLYLIEGGVQGYLGQPLGTEVRANSVSRQEFVGGTAYWTAASGAAAITGAIRATYLAEGGPASYLGYPIGVEYRQNGASQQQFQGGTLFWMNRTGTTIVNGAIHALYFAEGGPTGYLGYPLASEVRANGASRQEFEGGTAYWTNATGASVINGAIRALYVAEGGPTSYLGYPVGPEVRANGASRQEFEGGTAYWTNATGASVINGAIRALYVAEGGPTSYLGYPVGPEVRANGASRQEFEGGTAYWTNATGASVINGAIRALYVAEGGPTSYLGYPVGPEVRANGASRQEFEGGTAYWTNATGASVINGAIRALYVAEGGPTSYLGYPVGPEVRANGASRQEFEGGTAYWTNATGASVINGAIRGTYLAMGGPKSQLRFPIGPERRVDGTATQLFEGGTLTWTPFGGVKVTFN